MKTVLITGAGSGFGHEVAMRLAQKEFQVIGMAVGGPGSHLRIRIHMPCLRRVRYVRCVVCLPGRA